MSQGQSLGHGSRRERPAPGVPTILRVPARLVLALGVLATVLSAGAAARPGQPLPRVTIIGDSVASSIGNVPQAVAVLGRGTDLQLQLAPCRRLGGESCPYNGTRPLNAIDLVKSLGSALGPTVIVSVGYNDHEDEYASDIEDMLAALKQAGVTRVLWTTLKTAYHSYLDMNDMIFAAAARHPEMTVVDWNVYSMGRPDWFAPDGLHLSAAGAVALSSLLHDALVQLGIPATQATPPASKPVRIATFSLPDAVQHRPYSARLVAHEGTAPYRWSNMGVLPAGLRLSAAGRITGTATGKAGIFRLALHVVDASGHSAAGRASLRVRPPRKTA